MRIAANTAPDENNRTLIRPLRVPAPAPQSCGLFTAGILSCDLTPVKQRQAAAPVAGLLLRYPLRHVARHRDHSLRNAVGGDG